MRSIVAWLLFALAAAIPSVPLIALAIHTATSEEVRARADQLGEREEVATTLRREGELTILRGQDVLRSLADDASEQEAEAVLAASPQPFADGFLLRADAELVVPRAGGPLDVPGPNGAPSQRSVVSALLVDPVTRKLAIAEPQLAADLSRLTVFAQPQEAKISVDGMLLPGNPVMTTIPRDGASHRVRVEAPGYISKLDMVVANSPALAVKIGLTAGTNKEPAPPVASAIPGLPVPVRLRGDTVRLVRQGGTVIAVRRLTSGCNVGWVMHEASALRGAAAFLPPHLMLSRKDDIDMLATFMALSGPMKVVDKDPAKRRGMELAVAAANPSPSSSVSLLPPAKTREAVTEVIFGLKLVFQVAPRDAALAEREAVRNGRRVLKFSVGSVVGLVAFAAAFFGRARRAQRLADLRTDFVAAVSHELRTPLASVRMLAELLEAGAVAPEERVEVEQTLAGETRRLNATLERMLRFGALARGKLAVDKQRIVLASVVKGAADRASAAHPRQPVVVEVEPSLEANLDAGLVGLALDNLLTNAAKYAPDSGPVTVRAREDGAHVVIDVVDRGPGLDRRALGRVFLPFERADNRLSRATEGTGVGLALVRGIARAHGGDAKVTSAVGAGSTFTLRLPRV